MAAIYRFLCALVLLASVYSKLKANETELIAFQALQASASLPILEQFLSNQVNKNVDVASVPNLFAQQQGVKPSANEFQLDNFGALSPWENIMDILKSSPSHRLLILIRHGQAWENLNPTSNANCEFTLNNEVIQNFDSPLSPDGRIQSQTLNSLFKSTASNSTHKTWYETIGLASESTTYITSPSSRTLQTTEVVFDSLPLSKSTGSTFIANELIRATMGTDVCNSRHSVRTPTNDNILPSPWSTGCQIPTESLQQLYEHSGVNFTFPIRPAGGNGFGLVSDYDELWRSDTNDVINTRAKAFLNQVFEYTQNSSIIAVVTHGEMVNAIYEAAGEAQGYDPKNTQVVPLMVKYGV